MKTRIDEHKKSIENHKKLPVPIHIQENNSHNFDFDNVVILDRESNYKKRIVSEMFHINSYNDTINRKEDVQFLNSQYKSLSRMFSRR